MTNFENITESPEKLAPMLVHEIDDPDYYGYGWISPDEHMSPTRNEAIQHTIDWLNAQISVI